MFTDKERTQIDEVNARLAELTARIEDMRRENQEHARKTEAVALERRDHQDQRLARLDQKLDRNAAQTAETRAKVNVLEHKIDQLSTVMSSARGGLAVGKWIVGILLAASTLATAVWAAAWHKP